MNKLDSLLQHVPTDLARQIKEAAWEQVDFDLCCRIVYMHKCARAAEARRAAWFRRLELGLRTLESDPAGVPQEGMFGRPADLRATIRMRPYP